MLETQFDFKRYYNFYKYSIGNVSHEVIIRNLVLNHTLSDELIIQNADVMDWTSLVHSHGVSNEVLKRFKAEINSSIPKQKEQHLMYNHLLFMNRVKQSVKKMDCFTMRGAYYGYEINRHNGSSQAILNFNSNILAIDEYEDGNFRLTIIHNADRRDVARFYLVGYEGVLERLMEEIPNVKGWIEQICKYYIDIKEMVAKGNMTTFSENTLVHLRQRQEKVQDKLEEFFKHVERGS